MKIRSLTRVLGAVVLAGAIWGICFTSCRHEGDPMDIYGVWQEKGFVKYQFTLDSITKDTIRHLSHSQHELTINCFQKIDSGNFTKGGDFELIIFAWHDSSYRDPERRVDTEYVKGYYMLDTKHKKIRMDGLFYTKYGEIATESTPNYNHSIGSYKVYSDYYINDKFFTLSLNDSTRNDINTFYPIELYTNCH